MVITTLEILDLMFIMAKTLVQQLTLLSTIFAAIYFGYVTSVSSAVRPNDPQSTFESCLESTGAEISFPSNETWWYDSQSVHVPVLRHPFAVAYAKSGQEVSLLVKCAVQHKVKIAPRCGGHSYEGFSNADDHLVVDVTRINYVSIDGQSQTAEVGAGIRLGNLYYVLGEQGFAFPAGECSTVGLTGHMSAGGIGVLMRKWGLAADNVLQVKVVDWRGKVLTANERVNPELYFAVRGGGGGSYGIITQLTLKIYPYPHLSTAFTVRWKNRLNVEEFNKVWFAWAPWDSMPDTLGTVLFLGKTSVLYGFYIGDDGMEGVNKILSDSGLLNLGGEDNGIVDHYSSKDLMEAKAWIDNNEKHYGTIQDFYIYNAAPYALKPLNLPPVTVPVHETWALIQNDSRVNATPPESSIWYEGPIPDAKPSLSSHSYNKQSSQIITKEFDQAANEAIEEYIDQDGYLEITTNGGLMSRLPDDTNAFPHRKSFFVAEYYAPYYLPGTHNPSGLQGQDDMNRIVQEKLEPYTNHTSYQGYCDILWTTDPKIYMPRYYGNNVARLVRTKRRYDPQDVFCYEQSTPVKY